MLDPQINHYAVVVTTASGLASAGAHATALAGSGHPWPPKRVLIANLISTALIGMATAQIARWVPFELDLMAVLIASAISGHTLGPRGVAWLFRWLVQGFKDVPVIGKSIPPPPDDPPTTQSVESKSEVEEAKDV